MPGGLVSWQSTSRAATTADGHGFKLVDNDQRDAGRGAADSLDRADHCQGAMDAQSAGEVHTQGQSVATQHR